MGGVAKGVGNVVGSVFGGLAGGMIDSAGLGNSFQAQAPEIVKQQELLAQIQASQQGMNPINQGQNQLAQALLAQSQGQGPNPAQLMMRQGQDRANMMGAGQLASAKGMNPALAARQAAQNSMMGNQQTIQQAGVLGAQQQLGAQQALGGMYGQMGNQNLGQQQLLQQALAEQNRATSGASLGAQGINAQVAAGNAAQRGAIMGGLLQAGGAAGAAALGGKAHGGFIDGHAPVAGDSPKNDVVPAMLSPGEIVIPRSQAQDAESAKAFIEHLMKQKGKKKGKA